MKHLKQILSAVFCMALLPIGAARAEFSQGLSRLEQLWQNGGRIETQMTFSPEDFLSVGDEGMQTLQSLFEGLTIRCVSQQSADRRLDAWTLAYGGVDFADAELIRTPDGASLESNLLPASVRAQNEAQLWETLGVSDVFQMLFALRAQGTQDAMPYAAATPGQAYEMQMSLTQEQIENLFVLMSPQMSEPFRSSAEALLGQWTLTRPLQLDWTASETGELARLKANAAASCSGGDPWTLRLDVRVKNGNVDAELNLEQDKRNTLQAVLAVDSTSTKATRSKEAAKTQKIRLNVSGKLGGYSRTFRLSASLGNTYRTNDAGKLSEILKNTLTIGYTDKDPAVQMLGLGDVSLTVKERVEAVSGEAAEDVRLNETLDVDLSCGEKRILKGTAQIDVAGAEAVEIELPESTGASGMGASLNELPQRLLERLFPLLPEDTKARLVGAE